jgi:hypothetical protein
MLGFGALAGVNAISVDVSAGWGQTVWPVGSRILITTSSYNVWQAEERTVVGFPQASAHASSCHCDVLAQPVQLAARSVLTCHDARTPKPSVTCFGPQGDPSTLYLDTPLDYSHYAWTLSYSGATVSRSPPPVHLSTAAAAELYARGPQSWQAV